MATKGSVGLKEVGFYFSLSGNDSWSGKSIELPKKTIQAAIDAGGLLAPSPGATAVIIGSQGGDYTESIVMLDSVLVSAPDITMIIDAPIGIKAASVTSINGASAVNNASNSSLFEIDGESTFGAEMVFCAANGDNSSVFDIKGAVDNIFLTVRGLQAVGSDSVVIDFSGIAATPIIINSNQINLIADNTVGVRWNPSDNNSLGILRCAAVTLKASDFLGIDQTGANTTVFHILGGRFEASVNSIDATTFAHIENGAIMDCVLASMRGDIVVDAGGVLNIICVDHIAGTVTNNGTINGIIDGVHYGNYFHDYGRFELLPLSTTDNDYDADPVTLISEAVVFQSGTYEVRFGFDPSITNTNRRIVVGLFIDDIVIDAEYELEFKDSVNMPYVTKILPVDFTAGPHDIRVDFGRRGGGGATVVGVTNVRVMFARVM